MTRGDVWVEGFPDRDSNVITLLAAYRECNNGQAPRSIEEVEIEETAELVTIGVMLRLPVTPFWGNIRTCQGNQALAFSVELSEALGNRQLGVISSNGDLNLISDE